MTTIRTIRYRLLPRGQQGVALDEFLRCCAVVRNQLLADHEGVVQCAKLAGATNCYPSVTFFSFTGQLTTLRQTFRTRDGERVLMDAPVTVLRSACKDLAEAFKAYFRRIKAGEKPGYPRFVKQREWMEGGSFGILQDVRIGDRGIRVPKIGWVRLRRRGGNPYHGAPVKTARIKKHGGKWFACLTFEVPLETAPDDGLAVGVDMNVLANGVALSTGEILVAPSTPKTRKLDRDVKYYQRQAARRRKGSVRYLRTRAKLNKLIRQRAAGIEHWRHEASRAIADTAGHVAVEDLNVKGMTRSAKGTVEKPGTNVAQKRGLNRAMLSAGNANLRQKIEYKAHGFEALPAHYTSLTCSRCGHVSKGKESRKTQSLFDCAACDARMNADVNAARNVLARSAAAEKRGWAIRRPAETARGHEGSGQGRGRRARDPCASPPLNLEIDELQDPARGLCRIHDLDEP